MQMTVLFLLHCSGYKLWLPNITFAYTVAAMNYSDYTGLASNCCMLVMCSLLHLAIYTGVRNKQSVGSSSTMGGSSRCVRGFWRTDSQTRTIDSDMRSLMSLEDMSDLCQALPIEA